MATTAIRLTDEESDALERLADRFGGKSNLLRAGLRKVVAEEERMLRYDEFLAEWQAEAGLVTDEQMDIWDERLAR